MIKQGEIWLINFDPQIGSEIKKTRPAVVIDDDYLASEFLRFVVPITSWKNEREKYFWYVKVEPSNKNGLDKISSYNVQQSRYLSTQRFIKKIGNIDDKKTLLKLQEILFKFINADLIK